MKRTVETMSRNDKYIKVSSKEVDLGIEICNLKSITETPSLDLNQLASSLSSAPRDIHNNIDTSIRKHTIVNSTCSSNILYKDTSNVSVNSVYHCIKSTNTPLHEISADINYTYNIATTPSPSIQPNPLPLYNISHSNMNSVLQHISQTNTHNLEVTPLYTDITSTPTLSFPVNPIPIPNSSLGMLDNTQFPTSSTHTKNSDLTLDGASRAHNLLPVNESTTIRYQNSFIPGIDAFSVPIKSVSEIPPKTTPIADFTSMHAPSYISMLAKSNTTVIPPKSECMNPHSVDHYKTGSIFPNCSVAWNQLPRQAYHQLRDNLDVYNVTPRSDHNLTHTTTTNSTDSLNSNLQRLEGQEAPHLNNFAATHLYKPSSTIDIQACQAYLAAYNLWKLT